MTDNDLEPGSGFSTPTSPVSRSRTNSAAAVSRTPVSTPTREMSSLSLDQNSSPGTSSKTMVPTPRTNTVGPIQIERYESFTTNTDDEISHDYLDGLSESLSCASTDEKLPIYDILNVQLNALWVSEINERLSDLTAMFRTSRMFQTELEVRGDSLLTVFPTSSTKIGEESRMLAWYNSVCQLLGLLETILTQLRVTPRYQNESNSNPSLLKAGTSKLFKGWLQGEINKAEEDADSYPECSLCPEQFESTLSRFIQDFSVTTARLYGGKQAGRKTVRKGSKPRVKEPYHYLNETLLGRIIPILLKVRPLLDKNGDLYSALKEFSKDGDISTVTLADVFQNHLVDSDWLKDHLADIEIRLPYHGRESDDVPSEPMTLPDWLPDLDSLYSLIIVIMMRYPASLAKHVLRKFGDFAKKNSDNSNFIAEMRPVLEECSISTFCAETLNLSTVSPGHRAVLDSVETMRKVFRELLKTYITKVLMPEKDWLGNDKFDRSQFLSRINSMGIFSDNARQYEAGTIGSLLKHELNRLKTLCKRMQISSTPFLCYNFSNVVMDLLSAIITWFENRFVKQFHPKLNDFLQITNTDDLTDPTKISTNLFRRQLSFQDRHDMDLFRDEKQKELLKYMMITLRTNKNLFIDEEAQKV